MTHRTSQSHRRGAALVTVMVLMGILAMFVAALLMFTARQRQRTTELARSANRLSCAETGLQYARSYFAANQLNWNTYLADPSHYNPIRSTWNTTPADPLTITTPAALLLDIDGDGRRDVYVYVRDNDDEIVPEPSTPSRDNDQAVIVGAVCVSSTMGPRLENGSINADPLLLESILSYNNAGQSYKSQAGMGATGSGNLN